MCMWNVTLGNQFRLFFASLLFKDKWPFICVQWTVIIQSQEVQKRLDLCFFEPLINLFQPLLKTVLKQSRLSSRCLQLQLFLLLNFRFIWKSGWLCYVSSKESEHLSCSTNCLIAMKPYCVCWMMRPSFYCDSCDTQTWKKLVGIEVYGSYRLGKKINCV